MKVSECIIQGAEEDGGCLQKKEDIIKNFNARGKYWNGLKRLLKVMLGK